MNKSTLAAVALALALAAVPAHADELLGSYNAHIGKADLYNSNGKRLTRAWQVLRQDRANFHKFGISQPGDETDDFFDSIENRAALEFMVEHGNISREASRAILKGGATVHVEIYGNGGRGSRVGVIVSRD